MKRFACSILVTFLSGASMLAQTKSLLIEDLTWTEVRDAIIAGKTTAIYYAGSIEQNGPGMALGKHVFIARYLAPKIAEQLDNALVYPVMPFCSHWRLGRYSARNDRPRQEEPPYAI